MEKKRGRKRSYKERDLWDFMKLLKQGMSARAASIKIYAISDLKPEKKILRKARTLREAHRKRKGQGDLPASDPLLLGFDDRLDSEQEELADSLKEAIDHLAEVLRGARDLGIPESVLDEEPELMMKGGLYGFGQDGPTRQLFADLKSQLEEAEEIETIAEVRPSALLLRPGVDSRSEARQVLADALATKGRASAQLRVLKEFMMARFEVVSRNDQMQKYQSGRKSTRGVAEKSE